MRSAITGLALTISVDAATAQVIDPNYAGNYRALDIGRIPVSGLVGGIAFKDANTLYVGANCGTGGGEIDALTVTRGIGGHILGFSGPAVKIADAPYVDAGLHFGLEGVLFYTASSLSQLSQVKPGSGFSNKSVDLGTAGITSPAGSLAFVPPGFSSAGSLKLISDQFWYTTSIYPDGSGVFGVDAPWSVLPFANSQGAAYVLAGQPLFEANSVLINSYDASAINSFEVDLHADPMSETGKHFMDVQRPFVLAFDPIAGDLLVGTSQGPWNDHIVVVRGFSALDLPSAPTITAAKETFELSEPVVVNFSNTLGIAGDWIGFYAAGSSNSNLVTWLYTDGTHTGRRNVTNGSITLPAGSLPPDAYEARLFSSESYGLLAHGGFSVAESVRGQSSDSASASTLDADLPLVTTDKSTYAPGERIVINFSNAAGGATDWIGLYVTGATNGAYLRWCYTDGSEAGTPGIVNGSVTFTNGLPNTGSYEVRFFFNDNFVLQASASFTVQSATAPSLRTSKNTYAPGEQIVVNFSNASGNALDWVGLYVSGATNTAQLQWTYTDGTQVGTAGISTGFVAFTNGLTATGSYEARLFFNDSYTLRATVGFSVQTGLPGSADNPSPAPGSTGVGLIRTLSWTPGSGATAHKVYFGTNPNPGPAELKANQSGRSYTPGTLAAQTTYYWRVDEVNAQGTTTGNVWSFTTGSGVNVPTLTTSKGTYAPAEPIAVTFSNASGSANDWIGLYAAGANDTNYLDWCYTSGTQSGQGVGIINGTVPFTNGLSSAGTYEARLFFNFTLKTAVTFNVSQAELRSSVLAEHIFYNNSAWDGNDPNANANDDNAIAPDKSPLRKGGIATFSNYTSYSKGINGVMIDILGLPGTPTASDFTFKIGNDNNPTNWTVAPAPSSITVRPGAGVGGSQRVTLIWPDNAIKKAWLEVTVLPTINTGLSVQEVFYLGNAVGDCGNSTTDARVDVSDEDGARNHPRNLINNPAPIDDFYDYNRDRKVDIDDEGLARINTTTLLTALKLINLTGTAPDENQPPVITLSGGTITYTENAGPLIIDTLGGLSDPASSAYSGGTLTVDLVGSGTADDRLGVAQGGGAEQIIISGNSIIYGGITIGTLSGGTGTSALVVTFNANSTPDLAQEVLRKITYENVSCSPSTTPRTIRFVTTNGRGLISSPVTKTVNIATVGTQPPVITLSSGDLQYTEHSGPVLIDGAAAISGFGGPQFCGGTLHVEIISGQENTDRVFIRNRQGRPDGITVGASGISYQGRQIGNRDYSAYDPSSHVLVQLLPGVSQSTLQLLLRSLLYESLSDNPAPTKVVRVYLTDASGNPSPAAEKIIRIATLNDPPVLQLSAGPVTYSGATPVLVAPEVLLTDPDSANFGGGSVVAEVTDNGTADDRLAVRNEGLSAGQIGVQGASILYGGTVIGSFTGGAGSPLQITLFSAATPPASQALIRKIAFENQKAAAGAPPRRVRITVTDGGNPGRVATIRSSLVSYWSLDETSGNRNDNAGANNLLEQNGSVSSASGVRGMAADFSSGAFLSHVMNADLDLADSPCTVTCWVQLDPLMNYQSCILANGVLSGFEPEFQAFRINPGADNPVQVTISNGSAALGSVQPGAWTFLAFSADPQNGIFAGNLDDVYSFFSYSPFTPLTALSGFFSIGAEGSGNFPMDGRVDEVGVWKRMLSPAELQALFNNGQARAYPLALNSDTKTIQMNLPANQRPTISQIPPQVTDGSRQVGPISFTVGDAETQSQDLQVNAVSSDQAIVPAANIVLGGTGADRTVRLTTATPPKPGQATITLVVTDGGALTASASFTVTVSPITAGGMEFNGGDSYVDCGSVPNTTGNLTIAAWVYARSEKYNARIVDDGSIMLYCNWGNHVIQFDSGDVDGRTSAPGSMLPNRWVHVAVTRTAAGVENFYIDGQPSGAANQTTAAPLPAVTNLCIGNRVDQQRPFDGFIEDVRIYSRVLSKGEIEAIYECRAPHSPVTSGLIGYWPLDGGLDGHDADGPVGVDLSGGGHTGMAHGTKWHAEGPLISTQPPCNNRADVVELDGVDDYIDCGAVPNTTADLTIAAWIYLRNWTYNGRILDNGATRFYCNAQLRAIQLDSFTTDGANSELDSLQLNKWIHVAVTRTAGGSENFYIDGEPSAARNQQIDPSFIPTSHLYIGNRADGQRPLDGYIQDVRVYNRVLSDSEIHALRNTTTRHSTAMNGLIGDWPLDDGVVDVGANGATCLDFSGAGHPATAYSGTNGTGCIWRGAGALAADSDSDGLPDAWEFLYFGNVAQDPSGDPDGDGLTNLQEYQLGTDPVLADSDGNGVNDGDEDFDGDLLSNWAELNLYHSSPFDAYSLARAAQGQAGQGQTSQSSTSPASQTGECDLATDALYLMVAPAGETGFKAHLGIVGIANGKIELTLTGADTTKAYDIYIRRNVVFCSAGELTQEQLYYRGQRGQTTFVIDLPTDPQGQGYFTVASAEDSDGDGLPDGFEVLVTRTNLNVRDTGGQGVSDANKDIDGDGATNLEEFESRMPADSLSIKINRPVSGANVP
jgi:hypothetical protein